MSEPMDRSRRPFAGRLKPFQEVFPMLKEAIVQYTESEYGTKVRSGTFSVRTQGGLMACGNEHCRRGGYQFDREIGKMLHDRVTQRKVGLSCPGDRGSPKGRRKGQGCVFSVEAMITLQYETEPSPA